MICGWSETLQQPPREDIMEHSQEESSYIEDAVNFDNEEEVMHLVIDSSRHLKEMGSNSTGDMANAATNGVTLESSPTSPELWGMPVQSIILLNLVAVIWGTQHAVIKSVVDDNTNSVANNGGSASGDSTAAYFTLARFGLAALLASPYTPGWRLLVDNFKEKLGWVESTALVNGVDGMMYGEEQSQSQQDHSRQNAEGVTTVATNSHANTLDERESVKLAWRYGAELGLYMFLGYAFQAIGLETTTASRSGFLLYLNVKFVPFFSYFIFGKIIQRRTWISALVAFSGTALLVFDNRNDAAGSTDTGLEAAFAVGDLWSIAAAAASALFILRMEAASKAVPKSSELNAANLWTVAVLSLLWTMGISWNNLTGIQGNAEMTTTVTQTLPVTFAHAIQQTFQGAFSTIIAHPLPLIYLSGVTTALATLLQSKAQKDVSAERASVIYAMDPVYGAIFANILLGETLGGLGLIGAFLIVVAAATNAVLDFGGVSGEDAAVGSG